MVLLIVLGLLLLIDIYFYQAVLAISKNWSQVWKSVARISFWIPTVLSFVVLVWWQLADP
jgi:uncharacterized protein